jgi:hypothetical protein
VRKFRGIFFAMLNMALSMILFGIIVKSVSLGSTDGFGIKNVTYLGQAIEGDQRLNVYSLIAFNCLTSNTKKPRKKDIRKPTSKAINVNNTASLILKKL